MKHYIIVSVLIFLFSNVSFGQSTSIFFLDEFNVSFNRTTQQNDNTENRNGFGLGNYHAFRHDKKLNIQFGIEYNRTSQLKYRINHSHFSHSTNVKYTINALSIPLGLRFNIGSKKKVFFETGGFADIVILAKEKGIHYNYSPDENYQLNLSETEFNRKAKLSDTYGLYVGIGKSIPIFEYELVIKTDCKFAINNLYSGQDNILNHYARLSVGHKFR